MIRLAVAVALALLPASVGAEKQDEILWLQRAECRGAFSDAIMSGTEWERERVAIFLELRRRGVIPPYSVEWCINQGIVPVQKAKRQPT